MADSEPLIPKHGGYRKRVQDRSCGGDWADSGRRGNPARRGRAWDSRNRPIKEDGLGRRRLSISSESRSWRWPGRPLSGGWAARDRRAW
jgi:hypothetical protein